MPGRDGFGGDDVPRRKSPERGWDKAAYLERKKDIDALENTLRDTYTALTRDATLSVLSQVDAIVQADTPRIDWPAIARSEQRTIALMQLAEDERSLRASIDEDDEVILLMVH